MDIDMDMDSECGKRNTGYGTRDTEHGIRNTGYGTRDTEYRNGMPKRNAETESRVRFVYPKWKNRLFPVNHR